jgi:cardiolipin synthase A/B
MNQYKFFDDPLKIYNAMLDDISEAQEYIYIETYKYGNDAIGAKFRDELVRKAKHGIKVRLLIDSWGASVSQSFFSDIQKYGGEVRFFKKIRVNYDGFTKNHRREHRKLLIVDDHISYIGSANIAIHSMNWRESVLRIEGDVATKFKIAFNGSWKIYNKYFYDKLRATKPIRFKGLEIIRDVPTTVFQPSRKRFLDLIRHAQKEIIFETPYFLPGSIVRKALSDAVQRGVKVKIISPLHSDVTLVDILRSRYFGELYRNGCEILLYTLKNLHAKVFLTDNTFFIMGSSNFDYRSFRFQHEINLFGKEKKVISLLEAHISRTLEDCEPFNIEKWKSRTLLQKIFERILIPFRHLF